MVLQRRDEPLSPAQRGADLFARPLDTPPRWLDLSESVETAEQRRHEAPPLSLVQGLEEGAEVTFRDRVEDPERFADLEHRRHGQLRPGERHGLLVLGEVLKMAPEAHDEVAVVETEGESPRPVPIAQFRDTPGARAVPLRQK